MDNSLLAILFSIVFLPIYVIAILMFFGIGGELVAGYHFSPKNKEAKKYHRYVMRRFGALIFLIVASMHALILGFILNIFPLGYSMFAVFLLVTIFGMLYVNKSKKMKIACERERELEEKKE